MRCFPEKIKKKKKNEVSANKLVWHITCPSGLPDTCPLGRIGGVVCMCVCGEGGGGGGGGLLRSASTKLADLTFV